MMVVVEARGVILLVPGMMMMVMMRMGMLLALRPLLVVKVVVARQVVRYQARDGAREDVVDGVRARPVERGAGVAGGGDCRWCGSRGAWRRRGRRGARLLARGGRRTRQGCWSQRGRRVARLDRGVRDFHWDLYCIGSRLD